jgi:hypothetical protein
MGGSVQRAHPNGRRPERAACRAARGKLLSEPALRTLLCLCFGAALSIVPASGRAGEASPLDRVAVAVEGAESSWGGDLRMWRPDSLGPQGPMQVSAAAAADVGGGDRFDFHENLALGRAYLGLMYRRFGSWADAVAAYNWGPGRLEAWIKGGRPWARLPLSVALYRARVLYGATLPKGAWAANTRRGFRVRQLGIGHAQPRRRRVPPLSASSRRQIAALYDELMRASASGVLNLR